MKLLSFSLDTFTTIRIEYWNFYSFLITFLGYFQALDIRRKILPKQSINIAATTFNIGETFQSKGNEEEAIMYYTEFLDLTETSLGEYHKDVAATCTILGTL